MLLSDTSYPPPSRLLPAPSVPARPEAREQHAAAEPGRMASDREYAQHVRDIESSEPARYNADPRRLYEIWEGERFAGARAKAKAAGTNIERIASESRTLLTRAGAGPVDMSQMSALSQ